MKWFLSCKSCNNPYYAQSMFAPCPYCTNSTSLILNTQAQLQAAAQQQQATGQFQPGQQGVGLVSSLSQKDTTQSGIKHDADKPDMSLLSTIAITEIAKVMTFGKKKYSANNWRGGFVWSRPAAAALRHIFAWLGGQDKDPETGLSHLAHACCCLFFLLEFEVTKPELDDRYKEPKK